jgi:hypothetical protein
MREAAATERSVGRKPADETPQKNKAARRADAQ